MSLLYEKTKEVFRTLLPVFLLVLLLCFTLVKVETDVLMRFVVGSIMLLIGLSVFLWGIDIALTPIGEYMSLEVATSKTPLKIALLSFLLGFLINVAEPDLLILGSQVQQASGGTLNASFIVYMVSIGVGIMVTLGIFRLLKGKMTYAQFMAITYGAIFILTPFVAEEFLAISVDASGATTGAFTTPFVLALSLGLSQAKGGKDSESNSFGLVGVMSSGPILAIMLMSIITGQKNIQGEALEFIAEKGVLRPILNVLPGITKEALLAILPISILFFIFNFAKFKLVRSQLFKIGAGLTAVLLGLILFLTAVNSGFMEMGRIIGTQIAAYNKWLLVVLGFAVGLIVVLVEPAVHVLGDQIDHVTGGYIPRKVIKITFSIGVGTAIALSMLRIIIPEVKLWYMLIPGFMLAVILSFFVDPIFPAIAYDAGGVASGPMTATFVLAFAQGAASQIETANVMVDGFGVIAMVAMAPVLSIMLLGTAFKRKQSKTAIPAPAVEPALFVAEEGQIGYDCIMVVVNRGFAESVVATARKSGATGATIMHGRATGGYDKVMLPLFNVELQQEKEIVLFITAENISDHVSMTILSDEMLVKEAEVTVHVTPTLAFVKDLNNAEISEDMDVDINNRSVE